jgi:ribonucleoside-diphosphate reductase alpha chain
MTKEIESKDDIGLTQKTVEVHLPPETLAVFGGDELRARVFYEKYALRDVTGQQVEKTPDQMWRRVARELASVEDEEIRQHWVDRFYWLLEDFRFVPGGRVLFGAGQSRKATLLNCLDGDTEVLVRESIEYKSQKLGYNNSLILETNQVASSVSRVRIRDIVGKEVEILTMDGWKPVVFRSYGKQEVYRVTLRNGDQFIATANHEWPVFYHTKQKPSKVTTTKLKGKYLFISLPQRPEINQDYYDGIVHGIIYGDGSRNSDAKTYNIYLFGGQRDLVAYLSNHGHVTNYSGNNPTLKGAVHVGGIRSNFDLKDVPAQGMSASYWYGFICGLIATDGHCSENGQVGIDQHDLGALQTIREQTPRVGMFPNSIFMSRENNPYNGQPSPLYRFNISKFSLKETDLLRRDHKQKFARRKITPKVGNHISVKEVVPINEEKEVYCCMEPATHTFIIGNGILTGNCYFFRIREDSIEAIFDFCREAARTYSYGGGVGCIEKDALVITQSGIRRIQSIGTGEKVLSFDPTIESFTWKRVLQTHTFDVKKEDSVLIRLENGSSIVTSYWHPTLVYNGGVFEYKRADEIIGNDLMLSPDMNEIWFDSEHNDPKLGWLLGAYLGDGSGYSCGKKVHERNYRNMGKEREAFRLKFANDDFEVSEHFAHSLNGLFEGNVRPHSVNRERGATLYEVSTNGYYVNEMLQQTDWQVGKKAYGLRVPSIIWSSSRETMLAFLAGLIDTDGHVNAKKQQISFSTISGRIIEDLQAMLSLFGVKSYFRVRRRRRGTSGVQGRHDIYELNISDMGFIKLIEQHMHSYSKKDKIMTFAKRYYSKKSVLLPEDFVAFFLSLRENKMIWSPTIRSQIRHGKRSLNMDLYLDGMKKLLGILSGQSKILCRYYLTLIPRLHKVLSAERGASRTNEFFDLTVEDTNNYTAGFGGFFTVHNTDISVLRPKGSPVNNAAIFSSGSVSFMELLSTTTGTIGQAGRRGALMITIRVDHPDVVDFINVKKDLRRVNYANISVKVTDEFMRAVERDADFELHFKNEKVEQRKIVKARDIWKQLIKAAWESSEPGVIFWDSVKRDSTTEYNKMEVEGVNPCVTGDTLVRTPDGWKEVQTLKPGDKIVTAYGATKPITHVEVRENEDVYQVEFSDGGKVLATRGHIFHIRRKGSTNKFWDKDTRLSDLREGDMVRTSVVNLPPNNPVETFGIPDREYGFLIGVLLGDGCYTPKVIAGGQAKIASDAREEGWNKRLMESFGPIAPSLHLSPSKRDNGAYIYLYRNGSAFILNNTLLKPGKSFEKEIPIEYVNANQAFHRGLIDGIFSTDGNVDLNSTNPLLRIGSSSRKLLEGIRLILAPYGIRCRIYKAKYTGKHDIGGRKISHKQGYHNLVILGDDLRRFRTIFSLSHPDKQWKLEKTKDLSCGGTLDYAKVKNIKYVGKSKVYDIFEEETDTWVTNGYVSRGCSEQTLENYGCCCLGSINLSAFVKDPFTDHANVDWDGLVKAAQFGVRFLDNVLDYNSDKHPLPQQKAASLWSRRIGVGITGLGDLLIKLGLKYDEEATVEFVDKLFERITNVIYDYSTELAKEKGAFPAFDAEKHLSQPFIQRLDQKVKDKIRTQGIRNGAVTTVPPVGSGSILAGCSSGIEPVFALFYIRRSKSLSEGEFRVYHPLVKEYMAVHNVRNESELPSYFVTAHQIRPEMRVEMQAAIQKHIDTAISSTVNLPQDISLDQVERIYFLAWKARCKGITVFREGSREGILETTESKTPEPQKSGPDFDRPRVMTGRTLKLKIPQGGLYVTANTGDRRELKEVFVTLGKLGGDEKADAEAIGRLISLYLQHGGSIENVIKMLKGIRGKYVSWDNGVQLLSIPDAVAKALEMLTSNQVVKEPSQLVPQQAACPDCGEQALIFENGCYRCSNCGYSKCE